MKFEVNPKYKELESFIKDIPSRFDTTGEVLYNKRNVVRRYQIKGHDLTVKRYKRPLFFQRFDYTFIRPSKAKRAYLFALRLEKLQIDTPEPIAYVEVYKQGLFIDGYFVSLYTDQSSLIELRQSPFDKVKADALAAFLVEMHQKGFLHGDLNLSNILYRQEGGNYHFSVIDINRSTFKENPAHLQCMDNLKRITHNRDLLIYLVTQYATIRQWDVNRCVTDILNMLSMFEQKKAFLSKFKKKGKG